MNSLRRLIRLILIENQKKDLITEPDETDSEARSKEDEASVVANIAGVTTPLGTGPTYPSKRKDKRKSPAYIAGRSFGNAKPAKK